MLRDIPSSPDLAQSTPRALTTRLRVALLCDGHVLVEGVPGLAKTTAVKTLAELPGRAVILHPAAAAPSESSPLLSERAKPRWIVSLLLVLSAALLVWQLR